MIRNVTNRGCWAVGDTLVTWRLVRSAGSDFDALPGAVGDAVQSTRDRVQIVREQVGVGIQGQGGGLAPEHCLHGLYVRADADPQRCCCVTKVVGG